MPEEPSRKGVDFSNVRVGVVNRVIDRFSPGPDRVLPRVKLFVIMVFQRSGADLSTAGRLLFEEEDG